MQKIVEGGILLNSAKRYQINYAHWYSFNFQPTHDQSPSTFHFFLILHKVGMRLETVSQIKDIVAVSNYTVKDHSSIVNEPLEGGLPVYHPQSAPGYSWLVVFIIETNFIKLQC